MQDFGEAGLAVLLDAALEKGIIDRFCVDGSSVRFWQGNLRLQFDREDGLVFLRKLLSGYHNAAGTSPEWTE